VGGVKLGILTQVIAGLGHWGLYQGGDHLTIIMELLTRN